VILLDTNLFMYAAGAEHRNKAPAARYLERVASDEVEAAIDAETLQEILYRYRAIGRWEDGRRVYDLARTLVPVVLPVTAEILDAARDLLDRHPTLIARDALHAAVALEHTGGEICSFDEDFDEIEGVRRTQPR
jgi:predicted nucleic acid-binding protein